MKPRLKIALFLSALIQAGCVSWQPPPEDFEQWKKPGVSIQDVMASLMECGYPSPSTKWFDSQKYWGQTWAASAVLAKRCMESQGYKNESGSKYSCEQSLAPQFRKYNTAEQIQALEHACDPSTPVPKPSVERRLNSPYCKVESYSKFPECQPVVVPSSQSEGKTSQSVVVPQYPVTDRLTPQVQKDSNTQMNQLLQETKTQK